MIIVGNGILITRDPSAPYFADGAVVVDGRTIAAVGSTADMRAAHPGAEFVDAKGGVIMPGFVNAHMHYYSAFSRGFPGKGEPAQNFNEVLERLWWRLDKALMLEDSYYSAMVCMIDCIKNGCTTVLDHHASPYAIKGSLFRMADAAKETGVRSCLCYEVSDRDGEKIMRQGIEENIDFINAAKQDDSGLLAGTFGLHASMTLSDPTLAACVEAMGSANAGYHVHVAEGSGDEVDSEQKYGKRIVNRFRDFGLTGDKSIFVHCIHINDEEKDILKETNTAVVHNPESNMGNAVGTSPVLDMYARGICLGLGTDGYVSDMLQSFKIANALQKHHNKHPNVAWAEIPGMLFANNPAIAGRYFATPVGKLAPGYAGDVIVSDYLPPTELTDANINGHLLFGASGRSITTTVANGRVLMRDRVLTMLDDKAIVAKARECSKKVWERI
ncbi:MAG: putative aminohydrolase SsnA [Planctomycetaceae bacterium]|nr:putative aminohydrolase SsnA [Planctomycetaceae bacterium]